MTPYGFSPAQQVHVKMHIIKNTGSMNLMVGLNDKPLRLIPTDTTYMLAGDTAADKVICNGEYNDRRCLRKLPTPKLLTERCAPILLGS